MILNGLKIKVVNPVQSGISRIGNEWKKQEIVLEWNESYQNHMGIMSSRTCNILAVLTGSRVDEFAQLGAKCGNIIEADFSFQISSGKFLNNEIYIFDIKIIG